MRGMVLHASQRAATGLALLMILVLAVPTGSARAAGPEPQQDRVLRVATKPLEPFVFEQVGGWAGFSIDLWAALAELLGLEYEWIDVETVTNQLEAVQNGTADLAIAGISMTPEREAVIDFSHPYFNAGLQVMVQAQSGQPTFLDLIQAYAPLIARVVAIGMLIAFAMSNIVWLIERRHNPEFQHGYFPGIWDGLWYFFGIVSTGEYQVHPTQGYRRILTAVWWLLGVILIAQFTAVMTTTLTLDQLSGQIRGPEDLPGKRVATVEGSTAAKYLIARNLGFVGVKSIDEAYDLLEQGQVDAVVYDAPVLAYYSATGGQGTVRLAGPIFQEETYGIALPTNSPLREPINAALLRLRQDGTYEQIYQRWFVAPVN